MTLKRPHPEPHRGRRPLKRYKYSEVANEFIRERTPEVVPQTPSPPPSSLRRRVPTTSIAKPKPSAEELDAFIMKFNQYPAHVRTQAIQETAHHKALVERHIKRVERIISKTKNRYAASPTHETVTRLLSTKSGSRGSISSCLTGRRHAWGLDPYAYTSPPSRTNLGLRAQSPGHKDIMIPPAFMRTGLPATEAKWIEDKWEKKLDAVLWAGQVERMDSQDERAEMWSESQREGAMVPDDVPVEVRRTSPEKPPQMRQGRRRGSDSTIVGSEEPKKVNRETRGETSRHVTLRMPLPRDASGLEYVPETPPPGEAVLVPETPEPSPSPEPLQKHQPRRQRHVASEAPSERVLSPSPLPPPPVRLLSSRKGKEKARADPPKPLPSPSPETDSDAPIGRRLRSRKNVTAAAIESHRSTTSPAKPKSKSKPHDPAGSLLIIPETPPSSPPPVPPRPSLSFKSRGSKRKESTPETPTPSPQRRHLPSSPDLPLAIGAGAGVGGAAGDEEEEKEEDEEDEERTPESSPLPTLTPTQTQTRVDMTESVSVSEFESNSESGEQSPLPSPSNAKARRPSSRIAPSSSSATGGAAAPPEDEDDGPATAASTAADPTTHEAVRPMQTRSQLPAKRAGSAPALLDISLYGSGAERRKAIWEPERMPLPASPPSLAPPIRPQAANEKQTCSPNVVKGKKGKPPGHRPAVSSSLVPAGAVARAGPKNQKSGAESPLFTASSRSPSPALHLCRPRKAAGRNVDADMDEVVPTSDPEEELWVPQAAVPNVPKRVGKESRMDNAHKPPPLPSHRNITTESSRKRVTGGPGTARMSNVNPALTSSPQKLISTPERLAEKGNTGAQLGPSPLDVAFTKAHDLGSPRPSPCSGVEMGDGSPDKPRVAKVTRDKDKEQQRKLVPAESIVLAAGHARSGKKDGSKTEAHHKSQNATSPSRARPSPATTSARSKTPIRPSASKTTPRPAASGTSAKHKPKHTPLIPADGPTPTSTPEYAKQGTPYHLIMNSPSLRSTSAGESKDGDANETHAYVGQGLPADDDGDQTSPAWTTMPIPRSSFDVEDGDSEVEGDADDDVEGEECELDESQFPPVSVVPKSKRGKGIKRGGGQTGKAGKSSSSRLTPAGSGRATTPSSSKRAAKAAQSGTTVVGVVAPQHTTAERPLQQRQQTPSPQKDQDTTTPEKKERTLTELLEAAKASGKLGSGGKKADRKVLKYTPVKDKTSGTGLRLDPGSGKRLEMELARAKPLESISERVEPLSSSSSSEAQKSRAAEEPPIGFMDVDMLPPELRLSDDVDPQLGMDMEEPVVLRWRGTPYPRSSLPPTESSEQSAASQKQQRSLLRAGTEEGEGSQHSSEKMSSLGLGFGTGGTSLNGGIPPHQPSQLSVLSNATSAWSPPPPAQRTQTQSSVTSEVQRHQEETPIFETHFSVGSGSSQMDPARLLARARTTFPSGFGFSNKAKARSGENGKGKDVDKAAELQEAQEQDDEPLPPFRSEALEEMTFSSQPSQSQVLQLTSDAVKSQPSLLFAAPGEKQASADSYDSIRERMFDDTMNHGTLGTSLSYSDLDSRGGGFDPAFTSTQQQHPNQPHQEEESQEESQLHFGAMKSSSPVRPSASSESVGGRISAAAKGKGKGMSRVTSGASSAGGFGFNSQAVRDVEDDIEEFIDDDVLF